MTDRTTSWPEEADAEFKEQVATLIREYLEKRVMTQKALARAVEASPSAVTLWLRGDRDVSLQTWTRIAATLRIPRVRWPHAKAIA